MHVLPELAAIAQFAADLRARLEGVGVDGLEGTLGLYGRLRETLDRIPPDDIERVLAHIAVMQRSLHEVARRLDELGRLKRATGF